LVANGVVPVELLEEPQSPPAGSAPGPVDAPR
jgi:hypothetical protein